MPGKEKKLSIGRLATTAVLAAIAIMTAGCDFRSVRPSEKPSGPHFTVMTYNVNYGMPGAAEAAGAILQGDADIVCLQETTPQWQAYLAGKLSRKYPHRDYKHAGAAGGMAFLAKRPFRQVAQTSPKAGWFPSWIIEADTPLGPVQICNVHLRPQLSDRGSVTPSAYFNSPDIHRREISEAYEEMDDSQPRLVVGDFNESDSGGAVAWLTQRGFKDALSQFNTSAKTWRWKTSLITVKNCFDHVMYSKDLHAVSAWVIDKGKSDHLPVVAIIERAK